jgi:hypothetical protein
MCYYFCNIFCGFIFPISQRMAYLKKKIKEAGDHGLVNKLLVNIIEDSDILKIINDDEEDTILLANIVKHCKITELFTLSFLCKKIENIDINTPISCWILIIQIAQKLINTQPSWFMFREDYQKTMMNIFAILNDEDCTETVFKCSANLLYALILEYRTIEYSKYPTFIPPLTVDMMERINKIRSMEFDGDQLTARLCISKT